MRKFFVLLLACLFVTGTASAGLAVVAINEANFPDAIFRGYISENFDTNKDGILANNEILNAKHVSIESDSVRTLEGVKYLTSLESLYCNYAKLKELDVSGLTSLQSLGWTYAEAQKPGTINASGCTSLESLYCGTNRITSINLEGCSSLQGLYCDTNKITSLDLKDCTSLRYLHCYDNVITSLDLSANTELYDIYCYNNKLESLNVKNCINLQHLYANDNNLSALDISNNLELISLQCKNNHLPLLNVADHTKIYSDYSCSPQHIDGLKSTRQSNGTYTVNLRDYLSASVKNVIASSVYGTDNSKNLLDSSYDSDTGIITFSVAPALVYYEYDTKYSRDDSLRYMGVTLAASAAPYITTSSLPAGYVDTAYTCQLEAKGETPITWTAEESLPDGLTLNSENGKISGTPSASGSYTLTITAANDFGSQTKDFTLTISGGNPSVNYETTKWEIANGKLTVQHTGSSSALAFSPLDGTNGTGFHISGDLPANLTIHLPADWELDVDDGAKVTASDTSKVKQASEVDGLKYPAVKIFGSNDITLNESGIIMTAWYVPSTPSAEVETTSWTKQGSKLIVETNGTPSRYEFDALTSPDTNGDGFYLTGLPSGLKINLPFPWGIDIDTSYNVTVSDTSKIIPHTDIPGLPSTAHRIMGSNTITLNASDLRMTAFLFTAPTITTDSNLGSYKAGDTISKQLKVEGTDWTMKLTAENLPEGLSMTSEGLISGSIKTAGAYKFTVNAENCAGSSSREFYVRITSGTSETLKITTASLTDATEGQSYSFQLEAEGTNLTWSAKTKLPENLTLSQSGLLSGTPTTAGTYRVIFTVKNSSGATDNAALTLKVKGSSSSSMQAPKVKTSKIPDAFIGEEYSYQLEAEGTVDEWKLADGSTLPGGLDLNESNGKISGTVTESSAKTFKFKVIAVNEAGESKVQTVSIKVVAKTPYFKTETLKSATWSKSYSFTVKLANIKAETWSIEGDLPEGMKFDKGKFSGKPKEVGDFDLTITASNGAAEITQDFTLKVASIPPKFSGSFKTGTEGKYYECKLKAKGSTPITWEFDSLPEGLTATPDATGEICTISGTPEEVFAQSVAITLTNGDNEGDSITAHKKLTIKAVKPKFETKAKDVPGGTVDETYSYQLKLQDKYTPSNVKWTYTGDMPAGLTLDEDNGTIYGVPEKAVKNSRFKVSAVNAAKESLKATLTITMTIKEAEDTRLPVLGESSEGESENVAPEFVNGIAYYERGEITAENLAAISSSGEVIIATFPAVEVDAEDLYEFTVSVDKSAPDGGVLVWHSFPDGEYDGGDSEEAYFLDSNNTDIKTVPEDYCVTVHAWLKPGVIYEPVIAVKISHND